MSFRSRRGIAPNVRKVAVRTAPIWRFNCRHVGQAVLSFRPKAVRTTCVIEVRIPKLLRFQRYGRTQLLDLLKIKLSSVEDKW